MHLLPRPTHLASRPPSLPAPSRAPVYCARPTRGLVNWAHSGVAYSRPCERHYASSVAQSLERINRAARLKVGAYLFPDMQVERLKDCGSFFFLFVFWVLCYRYQFFLFLFFPSLLFFLSSGVFVFRRVGPNFLFLVLWISSCLSFTIIFFVFFFSLLSDQDIDF